jgi:site-specific recombinase XerD
MLTIVTVLGTIVPMAKPAHAALPGPLVDAWLAAQASDNTRAAYRMDLDTFGRWCVQRRAVPLAVDTKTLAAFGAARHAAGDSDATIRRRWSSLSSFYRYAIEAGSLTRNPVDGITRPTERAGNPSDTDVLLADAVNAYMAMAASLDLRLDALLSLIVRDGVKLGEALALDVDDITGRPPKVSVTIRRNGRTRRVVLSKSSARAVRRCAGTRRGQPLFTSDQRARTQLPQRLSRFGADHLIRQLRDDTDQRVTANELRRFYITSNHDSGATFEEVRDGAGLAAKRTVARYLFAPERPTKPTRRTARSHPDDRAR